MFHFYIPFVPLAVAGALLFKKRTFAYGLPILLTLIKVAMTELSAVFFFTCAGLLISVFLIRKIKATFGNSIWAVAGYASVSIILYEGVANLGVWILGECVAYDKSLSGLAQCVKASLPFSAYHFLRDVPVSLFVVKALEFVAGRVVAKKACQNLPS